MRSPPAEPALPRELHALEKNARVPGSPSDASPQGSPLSFLPVQECVEGFVLVRAPLRILLLRRSVNRGGFWQPVSGKVEPSDGGLRSALLREVGEETGIRDVGAVVDLHWSLLFLWEGLRPVRVHAFGVEVPKLVTPLLSSEHGSARWCATGEALSLLYHPDNREGLRRLLARLGA